MGAMNNVGSVASSRNTSLVTKGGFRTAPLWLCHLTTYRPETQFPPKHDSRITTRNRDFTSLHAQGTNLGTK